MTPLPDDPLRLPLRSSRREPSLCQVERPHDVGEVTRHGLPGPTAGDQFRLLLRADLLRLPAACAEATARWRVCGARNVPLEDDAAALAALVGRFDRHGREQGLRV